MNCRITYTPEFAHRLKSLSKHYKSMRADYASFLDELRANPLMGTTLGKNLRKVRFPITSKGKGKSGGARVITHCILVESDGADVTLVTIYDKSEMENISDKELRALIKKNNLE